RTSPTATVGPAPARRLLPLAVGRDLVGAEALGHHLSLVDPTFDADTAGGRTGLEEAVVDVRAQRVERHAPIGIALGPRHLGPAEPTRYLDLDPFGAGAHRRGQRPFHRPPERDPVLELLGDRLSDEFGV